MAKQTSQVSKEDSMHVATCQGAPKHKKKPDFSTYIIPGRVLFTHNRKNIDLKIIIES
jgi:hypothetical protein